MALQNFIPPNDFTPPAIDKLLDATHKAALQFCHTSQPFILHPLLTAFTTFPAFKIYLIAANMNIFRGKDLHNLGQYILQKTKGTLLPGTIIKAEAIGIYDAVIFSI